MRHILALLLCALLSLMPCMALADGAPDALDMTRPLDSAAYQFDFAPWYSSMNDVLAAFGENAVWHRTSAGSLVSPIAGDMTIMECDYTSAITSADARLQLIFEAFADGDSTAYLLVGVRMIEELSDLDALNAYISNVSARFDDMAGRNVLDLTARQVVGKFASLSDNFASDPESAGRFSMSNVGNFTAPDGGAHTVDTLIWLSARKNTAEYMTGDAPYCAIYEFVLRPAEA